MPKYLGEYDQWSDPVWYADLVGMVAFYVVFYAVLLTTYALLGWAYWATALFWKPVEWHRPGELAFATFVSCVTGVLVEWVALSYFYSL